MSITPSFVLPPRIPASNRMTTERITLSSWKEIASELDRSVRTVQRWERELGLPVRRLGKGRRAPVFAFKNEFQHWLRRFGESSTRNPNAALLQSISDVFRNKKENCSRCGSPCNCLKVLFWVDDMNRSVSLPFCPACDVDGPLWSPLLEKTFRRIVEFRMRQAA